jgi:MFS family permease
MIEMRTRTTDYPRPVIAWYALSLLMIAYVVALLDRQILALLVEPVRRDLNISDTQVSLLLGFAFAIMFAVAALPIGHLVDHLSRRRIIVGGILLWSAMSILSGLSRNYAQLFAARVGVGIGEACLNPAAYSMLGDYFRPNLRGRAIGLFSGAGMLGNAVSLFMGGAILASLGSVHKIHVIGLGALPTWKLALILAGAPGLALALLMLTLREPIRQERIGGTADRVWTLVPEAARMHVRSAWPTISAVVGIYSLMALAGAGIIAWMPVGYIRVFGMSATQAATTCGLVFLVASVAGPLLGGYLSDLLQGNGTLGGRLTAGVTGVFGGAALAAAWLTDKLPMNVALATLGLTIQLGIIGSGPATVNELVPNELRGKAGAFYLLVYALLGYGFGPLAVALITQRVFGYDSAVRYAMAIVAAVIPVAAGCAWLMRGRYSATARASAELSAVGGSTASASCQQVN